MSPKLTDPNSFLTSLVIRKGRSDRYGIYLTGVNILADSTEDYGYPVSADIYREVEALFLRERTDWNQLLVATRREPDEIVTRSRSFVGGNQTQCTSSAKTTRCLQWFSFPHLLSRSL